MQAEKHDTGLAPEELRERGSRPIWTPWGELTVVPYERAASGWIAVEAWCPHVDGPLWEGSRHADELACPWHQWRYSLATGRCVWAPPADAEEAAETELLRCAVSIGARGTLLVHRPDAAR